VAPIVFATEMTVPIALAFAIGAESPATGTGSLAALGASLALVVASVVALSRTPALSALLTADAQHDGGHERPRRRRRASARGQLLHREPIVVAFRA
jgi:hypothetical protein